MDTAQANQNLNQTYQDRRQWLQDLVFNHSSVDFEIADYFGAKSMHQEFLEDFRLKWLSHLPRATLQGLDVPEIAQWRVGDAITFDRQYLHCGTSQIFGPKSFLAVFTYYPT